MVAHILHLYASFDTFCVQIGQFLETQLVLEKCLKTAKIDSSQSISFGKCIALKHQVTSVLCITMDLCYLRDL